MHFMGPTVHGTIRSNPLSAVRLAGQAVANVSGLGCEMVNPDSALATLRYRESEWPTHDPTRDINAS